MTDTSTTQGRRGGVMRIPRSRGALSGLLLIALGLWGALIPFVGPYFNYAYTDSTWQWTMGRFWLEVLPGAVAVLGGWMLLSTANRASAALGGWLASAAGAWFIVGPVLSVLWGGDAANVGQPLPGAAYHAMWETIGFFPGLGAVILFLGAHAAGRVTVRSVRDVAVVDRRSEDVDRGQTAEPRRAAETRRDEPRTAEARRGRAEPERIEPRRSESGTAGGATAMDEGTREDESAAEEGGRRRGVFSRGRRG